MPDQGPDKVSRRSFSGALTGLVTVGYLGSLGYPVYRYLAAAGTARDQVTPDEVVVPRIASLPPGSAHYFRFGADPALLIHYTDGTWAAFNAYCTHLNCTVRYQPEQARIFCACHNGIFDERSGAAVAGPPPRPLERFDVTFRDADAVVRRVQA